MIRLWHNYDDQKHLFVECIAPQKGVDSSRVLLLKSMCAMNKQST